jgi:hypothetical protein
MSKAMRLYEVLECVPLDYEEYRYLMTFQSKKPIMNGKTAAIILMNPSTAGYVNDKPRIDSTLGKVLCWCHRNDFSLVDILNLFAFRETYPNQLIDIPYSNLIGPKNNKMLTESCEKHRIVITAWGDCEGITENDFVKRTNEVVSTIGQEKLHFVGTLTKGGNPRHGRSWNFSPKLNKWVQDENWLTS